jgi:hypothetical protein
MALLLAPLLLAAATPAASDPDLRCVAAVSAMLGVMGEDAKAANPEVMGSLTSVFMYFLGKADARHPGFDYAKALGAILNAPGYDRQLPADLKRCGGEAEARGEMLKKLGEDLKTAAPLGETRPG